MFAGIALCLFSPVLLSGQETGLLRLDEKHRDPRNDVSLWGGVEDGRFRPIFEPYFQWSAGTEARLVRHGTHASWTGSISLEQMSGKYNRSSLFVEPDYFPMDLLDYSSGTGSRQTGRLETGFLADLSYLWAMGLNATFKATNDSRRSAFRHSSFGMEAELEPILTFRSDDDACIVSSYLVRLRTERAKMDQSNVDAEGLLPFFFDKGMSYGAYAYNPDRGLFPVLEFTHGFNEEYHSPEFSGGFGIVWKRGRAGDGDYARFRFPGSTLKGFFETLREGFEVDRTYRISYRRMRDQFREILDSGDGYESDSDRVGRSVDFKVGFLPHKGILRSVTLDLDGNYWIESAAARVISDRTQRLDASATLLASLSLEDFDVDLNVMGGKGFWLDRGQVDNPLAQGVRLTDNWLSKMEYYMAPRIGMGGALTYRFPAVEGLSLQLYGYWTRAFNATYLGGKNRETVTLKVEYNY